MEDSKNLNNPEAPAKTTADSLSSEPAVRSAEAGEANGQADSAPLQPARLTSAGPVADEGTPSATSAQKNLDEKPAGYDGQASVTSLRETAEENPTGQARILARAGEAFDAVEAGRALHEAGLKDPAKVEPTDQGFIFADPGESRATFVADDETLRSSAEAPGTTASSRKQPSGEPLPMAPPALDLTEAPDPDIPWRARPLAPGAEPLPMGVLRESGVGQRCLSIYDTDPGLFGPGDWLSEGEGAEGEPTELVLGVKFREYGSVYFFKAGAEKIRPGGKVLVDTEQGLSLAEVISARKMRLPLPKIQTAEGDEIEIKPIKGLPGPEDIAAAADNKILASGARLFCKECIRERNLEMKLVDVEVLHDRSKIIFYFTAPTRIDFRELVKDLVRNYRTRIELRQIGVRHETQMLGALGNCGMACCCRRYLRRFAPVTIKMAKEQNLFLNPAKLSGICGRLLCCLANEQENYEEFHRNCPKVGKKYQTTQGVMRVLRANLFRQSIVALNESGEEEEFLLDSWHALNPERLENQPRDSRTEGRPDGADRSFLPNAGVSEGELESLEDGNGRRQDRNRRDKRQGRERGRGEGDRNERRPRQNRTEGESRNPRSEGERGSRSENERGTRSDSDNRGSRPEGEQGQRREQGEHSRPGDRRPQPGQGSGQGRGQHERRTDAVNTEHNPVPEGEHNRSGNESRDNERGSGQGERNRAYARQPEPGQQVSGEGTQAAQVQRTDERGQSHQGPSKAEGGQAGDSSNAAGGRPEHPKPEHPKPEASQDGTPTESAGRQPAPESVLDKAAPVAQKAEQPDAEADNSIFGLPGSKFRK